MSFQSFYIYIYYNLKKKKIEADIHGKKQAAMKTKSGWEISGCVKNKRIELLTTAAPYVPAPIKRHPISYNHPPTPLAAVYVCVYCIYV